MPRLYLDPNRAFGGVMNDPEERLAYYRAVLASAERDELPAFPTTTACRVSGAAVMARLRAPAANGEVLAVPDFEAIPALVEQNRRRLDRDDVRIGGHARSRSCGHWRGGKSWKAAGSDADPDAPLLLAGHQPELAHPGVWVKNFALNGLARKLGGTRASPHRR